MSCCFDLLIECGVIDEEKKEEDIMDNLRVNYELKSIK